MNSGFFERMVAYILDIFIVSLVFSLVVSGLSADTETSEKMTKLTENFVNGEVTQEKYIEEYNNLLYESQKNNVIANSCQVILFIGYFVVFQALNKGQTIGKKILKIRVVDNETNNPANMKQIILRSLFIYNVISMILSILLVYIIPKNNYFVGVSLITIIESIFIIITTIMVVYRKDKRGLHDIIGKTKVISERG